MINESAKQAITYSGVGATSTLGAFIQDSLNDIVIWLFIIFFVVIADLAMSIYKIIKVREYKKEHKIKLGKNDRIRVSKGLRDTMGKLATYFAFVVAFVFVGKGANNPNLHIYACLAVIGGESLSIVGNWCKAHGYTFHQNKFLSVFMEKHDMEGVITKDDD